MVAGRDVGGIARRLSVVASSYPGSVAAGHGGERITALDDKAGRMPVSQPATLEHRYSHGWFGCAAGLPLSPHEFGSAGWR